MESAYLYFETRDARFQRSFSSLQKYTSALQQLPYENTVDTLDEYLNLLERTLCECLQYFFYGIVKLYEDEYLHNPTTNNQPWYATHENMDFIECLVALTVHIGILGIIQHNCEASIKEVITGTQQ